MSRFDIKPGATTARDIAHARMPESEPGKRSGVYDTGVRWIDQGPVCAGHAGKPGCFWTDDQRNRLLIDFQLNVDHAKQQFDLALERIRIQEIVSKPEDLNWFLSLALDIAGMHFAKLIANSIMNAAGPALDRARQVASDAVVDAAVRGEAAASTWRTRATEMILRVSPKQVESLSNAAFTPAKALAKQGLAAGLSHAPSAAAKSATQAYINQLSRAAAIAFRQYRLDASGGSTDAELMVVWTGMLPENHNVDDFQPVLEQKIERFKRSGVADVGTKAFEYGEGRLRTQTRVIYVRDIYGNKTPWYEKQTDDVQAKGHTARGDAQLDREVPEEFVEPAVQRSEQAWGPTQTIDDGYVQQLKSNGVDVDTMRKRLARQQHDDQHPLPAGSVFARNGTTNSLLTAPPASPLYAPGSVFDLPEQKPTEPDASDPLAAFRGVKP